MYGIYIILIHLWQSVSTDIDPNDVKERFGHNILSETVYWMCLWFWVFPIFRILKEIGLFFHILQKELSFIFYSTQFTIWLLFVIVFSFSIDDVFTLITHILLSICMLILNYIQFKQFKRFTYIWYWLPIAFIVLMITILFCPFILVFFCLRKRYENNSNVNRAPSQQGKQQWLWISR